MNEEARARPRPSPPPPPAPPQVSAAARGAPRRAVGAAPAARPSAGGAAAPRVGAHDAIGGRPRPAPLLPPGEVTAWRGRAPRAGGGGARPGGPRAASPAGPRGRAGSRPGAAGAQAGGAGGVVGGAGGRGGGGADVSAEGRPRAAVPGAALPRRSAAVTAPRGRAPNASRSGKFGVKESVHLQKRPLQLRVPTALAGVRGGAVQALNSCAERPRRWRCRAAFRRERARGCGRSEASGVPLPAVAAGAEQPRSLRQAVEQRTNQTDLINKLKLFFFPFCRGKRLEVSNSGEKAKLIKGLTCLGLRIPKELRPAEPRAAAIVCAGWWWVAAGGRDGTGQLRPLEQQQQCWAEPARGCPVPAGSCVGTGCQGAAACRVMLSLSHS